MTYPSAFKFILPIVVGSILAAAIPGYSAATGPRLQAKMTDLAPEDTVPVIVHLADHFETAGYHGLPKAEKRRQMVRDLKDRFTRSSAPVRQLLQGRGIGQYKNLWHINALAFEADPGLIAELERRPEVAVIEFDFRIALSPVEPAATRPATGNLEAVNVPDVWSFGVDGSGVTVAVIDSGADLDHPDLAARWRGGQGDWFDPIDNSEFPEEKSTESHGTAVTGVILGGDASGVTIGTAPGATWIAAAPFFTDLDPESETFGQDVASNADLHLSLGWALDPDGDPATDDAPDIVNNSWAFATPNVCSTLFKEDIDLLLEAGIAVVFAAGNEGPDPVTSTSPGNNPGPLAVGATDASNEIAFFSSRGPSPCDPAGTVFPELVAPGVGIFTTVDSSGGIALDPYTTFSGTSFSAPHVSGVLALLIESFPDASLLELETALIFSATDLGVQGEDNDYGAGLLDALAAWRHLDGDPVLGLFDPSPPGDDRDLDFGHVPPGSARQLNVFVSNEGSGTLIVSELVAESLPSPFRIAEDFCTDVALTAGESCRISLEFAPTGFGPFSGELAVSSNDSFNPSVSLAITGVGNTPPSPATLVLPTTRQEVPRPVQLQWRQELDADGDSLEYDVVYATNSNFINSTSVPVGSRSGVSAVFAATGLVVILMIRGSRIRKILMFAFLLVTLVSCGGSNGGGGTGTVTVDFELEGLDPETTYFWKVRTTDTRGAVVESDVRFFTTL